MKVFFLSLGCDKNLSDSEHMLGILREKGYELTDFEEEAEVVIVNTCCFIGDAKEESIREILRLSAYKKTGKLKALLIAGCLSERYREELPFTLPEVDGALGIASWDRISELVESALSGEKPFLFDEKMRLPECTVRENATGGVYDYLKIAEGCSKCCAYCVIPKVRGFYRSYPMEKLLEEAETMAKRGVRELILVAQETSIYGTDLYGKKMLPELLDRLNAIEGLQWIRILYCYPEEIDEEILSAIKRNGKVVHYLDLPIQHASSRILKKMNRRTDREGLLSQISLIREKLPDICIRTTLITGFPGEKPEDFRFLRDFVREVRFDRLGVFTYSREEGTPAASMKHQIPAFLKKLRRNRIMKLQQKIAFENAEAMIGQKVEVLIEGRVSDETDLFVGRTYRDAPDVDGYIFLHSDHEYVSGDFVKAVVTQSKGYDLIGDIIE